MLKFEEKLLVFFLNFFYIIFFLKLILETSNQFKITIPTRIRRKRRIR